METQCCGVVRQGMFNSWDRQPLLYTREPGGVLSIVPKTQQLRANFIFNANFNGRTNSGRRKTTPFGHRFVLNTYDRFAKTGSGQNRKTEAFSLAGYAIDWDDASSEYNATGAETFPQEDVLLFCYFVALQKS